MNPATDKDTAVQTNKATTAYEGTFPTITNSPTNTTIAGTEMLTTRSPAKQSVAALRIGVGKAPANSSNASWRGATSAMELGSDVGRLLIAGGSVS